MGRGRSKTNGGANGGGANGGGKPSDAIQFANGIKQEALIKELADEYISHLVSVQKGAKHAAGTTDIVGMNMRISASNPETAIHEFAHTLANTEADKFGLQDNKQFWSEIRKVRTAYRKKYNSDHSIKISSYADADGKLDEFMAEAFTQYTAHKKGITISDVYGKDYTFSKQVVDIVNKYFKRRNKVV